MKATNKNYKLRFACKEEIKFMLDIFKQYAASTVKFHIVEWYNFYTETKTDYHISIKANGLYISKRQKLPDCYGVDFCISKIKLNKWMKENNIQKPEFEEARLIK